MNLNSDEVMNIISESKTLSFMFKFLTKIMEIEQRI